MASDKMLGSFDQKSAPEDNDLLVEYDASASKVKNVKFGGVWNWIVKKLTSAVINELQTSSKNVVGAINELNSKSLTYLKSNRSSTAPVTFNIDSYKTYIIFVNHDGGNNSVVSLIYAESNPKLIELYRVGAVFTINLKNKTPAITSSTTYWNYTIIYV